MYFKVTNPSIGFWSDVGYVDDNLLFVGLFIFRLCDLYPSHHGRSWILLRIVTIPDVMRNLEDHPTFKFFT